jgi:hypothetical protein
LVDERIVAPRTRDKTRLGASIADLPPLKQMASLTREYDTMNIFYIIGVVVVVIVVAGFLGLRV